MEQISPIQALLQQRTLLQLEYYTEKEAFRKLTEQIEKGVAAADIAGDGTAGNK